MACVKPDGALTATALATLEALAGGGAVEGLAVAKALGKPLFVARGILRELGEAGLVEKGGEAVAGSPAAELFRITDPGRSALGRGKVAP
jgi:hypothetical protein